MLGCWKLSQIKDLQFLFFAHKNLYIKYNYFSTILIRFYMYMYNTDLLYIYFDNHREVITCIFHFIDCLGGFFFGQTFYVGHRNSPVYSLAFNSTSLFVALDVQVKTLNFSCYKWFEHGSKSRKDQKAATSDLNIFIACSQECRRIKNKFWQPTSSLQHLHVQSEMTFWNLS